MAARCLVFDVDDTLYLERDYVRSGLRAVDALVTDLFGVPGFFELAQSDFEQGRRGDLFDRALGGLGLPATTTVLARLVGCYRGHRPAIRLLPDARRALDAASAVGPVAVITDGPLASQQAKVQVLGLRRWASPVVLTADLFPLCPKPDPAAFRHVQGVLDADGPDCTYVADNPQKDFSGPAGLGWRTVRVRRANGLHVLVDSGPDVGWEVTSLDDLATVRT